MAVFAAVGHPVSQLGLTSARLLLLATGMAVVALSAFNYRNFEMPARRFLLRRPFGLDLWASSGQRTPQI
jgi:peptidoglycan/LPS O-acetylase OafA/YrhL